MVINYFISEGPSKFDLVVSLFDGKVVEFTQKTDKNFVFKIQAIVTSAEREDASRNSWNLKIYVLPGSNVQGINSKEYSAYYNSRKRTGTINDIGKKN
jgi:hypothetical protein